MSYRLLRTPPAVAGPLVPDAAQQAVLSHPGGPLLVLAGPGTGKTTTLVEAVARRVEAGLPADRVLVLTVSRKAAGELRDRITARLGTLKPGRWADFILVDRDPFQVTPREMRDTRVIETYIGGRRAWSR